MPRGYQHPAMHDHGHDADAGEWQALRGELVELLDQVEDQYARASTRDPGYDNLAQRVRDLRYQVAEPQPQTRQREALRSVQRAVNRFSERDEPAPLPPNPRDSLQSAILEIRSRQHGSGPESSRAAGPAGPRSEDDAAQRAADAAAQHATEASARRAADAAQRSADAAAQRATEAAIERTAEAVAQRAAEAAIRKATQVGEAQRLVSEAAVRRAEESAAAQRQAAATHYDQLAGAVGGITGRLERLEGNLKAQGGTNQNTIREVAEQVGQLTHVVELLAGAVGETGQVKRLESQITDLTELMHNGPKLDLSAMTKRIDDLSKTVERLAEIQVQNFGRESRDIPAQTEALKSGIASIEESVRTVYDRIDSIERSFSLSPPEIERLTGAMAAFTEAMSKNEEQPNTLVPLLDALSSRINEIEDKDRTFGVLSARINEIEGRGDGLVALRADIEALRTSVVGAVEPRFAAIENQIEALSDRVAAERPGEINAGALEDQIRQLVSRMDQTGEQLAGLAALYASADERGTAPDYDQIAALVAEKTSEAVARTNSEAITYSRVPEPAPALNEDGIAELERRMSALFIATSHDGAPEDISEVQDGIRKVDERLERLEAALRGYARDREPVLPAPLSGPTFTPVVPVIASPDPAAVAPRPSEAMRLAARESGGARIGARHGDVMPKNPAEDAPLTDTAFAGKGMIQAALDAKTGRTPVEGPIALAPSSLGGAAPLHQSEAAAPSEPPRGVVATPRFDPAAVPRPPRPQSSLEGPGGDVFNAAAAATPQPAPRSASTPSASVSSRNTFIEAARRAAQRQAPPKREADTNSLIGRALARFQNNATAAPAVSDKPAVAAAAADKAGKPSKAGKTKQAEPPKPARLYTPEPAPVVLDSEAIRPEGEAPVKESFLSRHRRPILLAASVVAVSLLTLNFIGQRMAPARTEPGIGTTAIETGTPTPASEIAPEAELEAQVSAADETAAPSTGPAGPRMIDMADTSAFDATAVGSISPAAAMNFTASQDQPLALDAGAATTGALGTDLVDSPVSFELAPAGVGPEGLRQAAAGGDARAQFEVAAIYTEGSVVPQDYAEAAKWYERAAAQGFAPAQYRLGSLYEGGKGVDQDLEQARLWYQRAAEAGNRMSMHNLAALYAGGELGKQEFESAAEWFEQAALRGMTDSQFNLGMLYARGLGVQQSLEASYKWFSIAAQSGDKDAATARDDIAKSLDAEAMSRVTAEIAAFKPANIDLAANFAPIGTWSTAFDPGAVIETTEVVAKVQTALNKLGYDVGTPDGLAGPKTAEAIKAFERSTGMTEVGAINPRLLAVLGSQPV